MKQFNLDKFTTKQYDEANYNCGHFLVDAWQEITGQNLSDALFELCTSTHKRVAVPHKLKHFKRLQQPVSPCIALFRGKTQTHAGIYLDNHILHLSEQGMQYVPVHVAMTGFDEVRYYLYRT